MDAPTVQLAEYALEFATIARSEWTHPLFNSLRFFGYVGLRSARALR